MVHRCRVGAGRVRHVFGGTTLVHGGRRVRRPGERVGWHGDGGPVDPNPRHRDHPARKAGSASPSARHDNLSAGDTAYLVGPYRELLDTLRKGQVVLAEQTQSGPDTPKKGEFASARDDEAWRRQLGLRAAFPAAGRFRLVGLPAPRSRTATATASVGSGLGVRSGSTSPRRPRPPASGSPAPPRPPAWSDQPMRAPRRLVSTVVAGVAGRPFTRTCPPRHASAASVWVFTSRTDHSHLSTRVDSTPSIMTQVVGTARLSRCSED